MRSPAAAERAEEATVEGGSLAGPAAASLFFSLTKERAAEVKCVLGWGIGLSAQAGIEIGTVLAGWTKKF